MKPILLVIALVAKADAPKAGLQEAAVVPAAVASEAVLPEARAVSAAETYPPPQAPVGIARCGAPPQVSVICEAETILPRKDATSGGAGVPPAQIVKAVIPPRIGAWAESRSDSDCNLADLYRRRFLSGPWSVKRRLEAARIRGDTEEVERLTAMLEEIVGEALEVEGMEQ